MKIQFDTNGLNNDSVKDEFRKEAREQGASDEEIDQILSGDDWMKKLKQVSY